MRSNEQVEVTIPVPIYRSGRGEAGRDGQTLLNATSFESLRFDETVDPFTLASAVVEQEGQMAGRIPYEKIPLAITVPVDERWRRPTCRSRVERLSARHVLTPSVDDNKMKTQNRVCRA